MDLQGFLNDEQNTNLSAQYLKKLLNIHSYIVQKSFLKEQANLCIFNIGPTDSNKRKRSLNIISSKLPTSPITRPLESPS